MVNLDGKTVLITGAAGNLGAACARTMAQHGGRVVVADLPGSDVAGVVEDIRAKGGEAIGHHGDLRVEADIIAMVARTEEAFGRVDVLVNNAAAISQMQRDATLEGMEPSYWDDVMAVNLRGAMLCCKHVIAGMRARKAGSIVNFGSTAGIRGDIGLIAYSTTKAALLGFTRAIATSYGKDGIRCNAISPGSAYNEARRARMSADRLEFMERTRLTPRLGVPEDIANMAAFLASDAASYVTGQNIVVDGGGTAHQPWVHVR